MNRQERRRNLKPQNILSPHRTEAVAPGQDIVAAVNDRDRAWFSTHPEQESYIRDYVRGEFHPGITEDEDDSDIIGVQVTQVEPGLRLRTPLVSQVIYSSTGEGVWVASGSV